jgi:adenylate kinase
MRTSDQIRKDIIEAQKKLIKNQAKQIKILKSCLTRLRLILK